VTRAGDVRLVPTPGHSRGHQSVLVRTPGLTVCLAGDATFDAGQLGSGRLAGICEDPGAAARSVALLRELVADRPTVYLPSHDPDAARRLAALEPS
jgi:glyoxylase-like metal-dependent hydrolase (beta-lactamase superfamily II)